MSGIEGDVADLQNQQARFDSLQLEVSSLTTLLNDFIAAQNQRFESNNEGLDPPLADPTLAAPDPPQVTPPRSPLSGAGYSPSEYEFASAPIHLFPSEKAEFVEWVSQPMPKGYSACSPSVTSPAHPHIYGFDDLASRSLHAKGHQASLTEYNVVTCGGFFLEVACSSLSDVILSLDADDVLLDSLIRVYNNVKSVSSVLNNRGTCIAVKSDSTASDEATDYCKLELAPTFEPAPQGLERLGDHQLKNFETFRTSVKRAQFSQQAKAIATNRVHAKNANPRPPAAAAAPRAKPAAPKPAAAPRPQPAAPRRQPPAPLELVSRTQSRRQHSKRRPRRRGPVVADGVDRRAASPGGPSSCTRHRVRERWPVWRRIGASGSVLGWIRRGLKIPWRFGRRPPQFNHGESCRGLPQEQQRFLDGEVQRLINKGVVQKALSSRLVSRAFLVPKDDGTWRDGALSLTCGLSTSMFAQK